MARVAYKKAYEAGDQDKLLQAQEMLNEAPEHDLARELNKASDVILKLIKM